jgi:YHS domain-containing protein
MLALAVLALATWAGAPATVNSDGSGLALHGYDPVAYFEDGRPVKGSADLTVEHAGATYRFASAANRDDFVENPERFVPQYGGYCAYGMAQGGKYDVDPEAWKIVNGKLYLNKNRSVQQTWNEDIPGYIAEADRNWAEVGKAPAK